MNFGCTPMGNYTDLEPEFIERTINLIGQYTDLCKRFPFEQQYNYTLMINCLLGLIIMPKERVVSFVPNERLTTDYKNEIGLSNSVIAASVFTLRDLIIRLRHSMAHFRIEVISENDENLIDYIEFNDTERGEMVARIQASELYGFLQYYASFLINNIRNHRTN